MKRAAKKQPKRKARGSDREFAAELVRRYREHDPYVFNEGSEEEYQFSVSGDFLAKALLSFAQQGTFDRFRMEVLLVCSRSVRDARLAGAVLFKVSPMGELVDVRDGEMIIKWPSGMKTTDAIGQVADEYGGTEDIVKNALYPRPKRKKPLT